MGELFTVIKENSPYSKQSVWVHLGSVLTFVNSAVWV